MRSTSLSFKTLNEGLSALLSTMWSREIVGSFTCFWGESPLPDFICLMKVLATRSIIYSGLSGLRMPFYCIYPIRFSHCGRVNTSLWSNWLSRPLTDTAKGFISMRPLVPLRWNLPLKVLPFILRKRSLRRIATDLYWQSFPLSTSSTKIWQNWALGCFWPTFCIAN